MKNVLLIHSCSLINSVFFKNTDIQLVGFLEDWKGAAEKLNNDSVDIIVLDLSFHWINILETTVAIKQLGHQTPILVIGGEENVEDVVNLIKLGCKGYLTKHGSEHNLIDAINSVSKGDFYIYPETLQKTVYLALTNFKLLEGLSPREIQVFLKVAKGQSINIIASELCITPSTISVYKSNIMRKMKFKNNTDFIHYALDHQLVVNSKF